MTQGRPDENAWVKSFFFQYSYDNEHWHDYIRDRDWNETVSRATTATDGSQVLRVCRTHFEMLCCYDKCLLLTKQKNNDFECH